MSENEASAPSPAPAADASASGAGTTGTGAAAGQPKKEFKLPPRPPESREVPLEAKISLGIGVFMIIGFIPAALWLKSSSGDVPRPVPSAAPRGGGSVLPPAPQGNIPLHTPGRVGAGGGHGASAGTDFRTAPRGGAARSSSVDDPNAQRTRDETAEDLPIPNASYDCLKAVYAMCGRATDQPGTVAFDPFPGGSLETISVTGKAEIVHLALRASCYQVREMRVLNETPTGFSTSYACELIAQGPDQRDLVSRGTVFIRLLSTSAQIVDFSRFEKFQPIDLSVERPVALVSIPRGSFDAGAGTLRERPPIGGDELKRRLAGGADYVGSLRVAATTSFDSIIDFLAESKLTPRDPEWRLLNVAFAALGEHPVLAHPKVLKAVRSGKPVSRALFGLTGAVRDKDGEIEGAVAALLKKGGNLQPVLEALCDCGTKRSAPAIVDALAAAPITSSDTTAGWCAQALDGIASREKDPDDVVRHLSAKVTPTWPEPARVSYVVRGLALSRGDAVPALAQILSRFKPNDFDQLIPTWTALARVGSPSACDMLLRAFNEMPKGYDGIITARREHIAIALGWAKAARGNVDFLLALVRTAETSYEPEIRGKLLDSLGKIVGNSFGNVQVARSWVDNLVAASMRGGE